MTWSTQDIICTRVFQHINKVLIVLSRRFIYHANSNKKITNYYFNKEVFIINWHIYSTILNIFRNIIWFLPLAFTSMVAMMVCGLNIAWKLLFKILSILLVSPFTYGSIYISMFCSSLSISFICILLTLDDCLPDMIFLIALFLGCSAYVLDFILFCLKFRPTVGY